jgi:hypothetical protein
LQPGMNGEWYQGQRKQKTPHQVLSDWLESLPPKRTRYAVHSFF